MIVELSLLLLLFWLFDMLMDFFLLVGLNHWENVLFLRIRIKVNEIDEEVETMSIVVFFFFLQETHVEIRESVRSKDVFIIQTGSTK